MKELEKLMKHKHFHWGGPVVAGGLTWLLTGLVVLGLIVGGVFFAFNTYNKGNKKAVHHSSSRRKTKRRKR